jgi:ATP synthase protein I
MRYPWLPALGLMGIGFYIAGAIILGIVGGHWLDGKFNSEPLWLIIGTILGLAVAVSGVYSMIKPFMENNKKDKGSK